MKPGTILTGSNLIRKVFLSDFSVAAETLDSLLKSEPKIITNFLAPATQKRILSHNSPLIDFDPVTLVSSQNLYDTHNAMSNMKGKRIKTNIRVRSIKPEHCFKELEIPSFEGRPWDEELYISRIATLSMMEDAVEAKTSLETTNKKLLDEIAERTRSEKIQQVLYTISDAVLTTRNEEELFGIFKDQLGTLLDTTNFYIAFYDEDTGMITNAKASDEKDTIESWPAARSLTGIVIQQNKPLLLTFDKIYELKDQGIIDIIGTPAQAWLGVPLEADGKATGAFVIQNYTDSNAYSAKDVDMLEFISNQISISIQRKKAVQDLTAALKKAEENDRLKTAFLNNISHEIRTPMNAIIGFAGFLNEPGLDQSERQEYTDIICKASKQLLSIIDDIINISTVEAGQEVYRPKETNINSMLRTLLRQFRVKLPKNDVQFNLSAPLPEEYSNIITDETKLLQIITNLLNNAYKFTSHGHISFGYNLNSDNLEFYVKDTGIGIDESLHQAIFDRFRQANSSISRDYGGTGLGLSISKAYVELLGGRIWLDSKPGEGTSFYFSIPYNPVNAEHTLKSAIPEQETTESFSRLKILIAEDEKFNYLLLKEIFKGMNATIIWTVNGMEAVNVCKTTPDIDLVLMDMKMPVMDGFEATIQLKKLFPDLPVIAQSAYASEKDRIKILECGCDDLITKPFDVKLLKSTFIKYFESKKISDKAGIH